MIFSLSIRAVELGRVTRPLLVHDLIIAMSTYTYTSILPIFKNEHGLFVLPIAYFLVQQ